MLRRHRHGQGRGLTFSATVLTSALAASLALGPVRSSAAPLPAADPVGGARLASTDLVLDLPAGVPAPPDLKAPCFVVADATSGAVIAAKCAHTKALPASTMKALTALALSPGFSEDAVVTALPEDAAQEGTKVGLVPGQTYTRGELLLGMLMVSGNDAAWALGRTSGMDKTLDAMNATAAHLGAHDTVARNPSGLDADGQTTSAYDLALLGRAAVRDPLIAKALNVKTALFPGVKQPGKSRARTSYQIGSHNRLLWNYDGAIGVKNGYTQAAKHTYIGAARRGDRSYLVTFVGSPAGAWRDTSAMFDWAFAYGDKTRPVGRLVEPGEVAAAGAPSPAPADGATPASPSAVDNTGIPSTGGNPGNPGSTSNPGSPDTKSNPFEQLREQAARAVAANETAAGVGIAALAGLVALGVSHRRRRARHARSR